MRAATGEREALPHFTAGPNIHRATGYGGRSFMGFAAVSRDYEPVKGQWYENVEEDDSFRVLSVDEDADLVEIEYLDGDIEEMDIEAWHEMDLERIAQPEGWAGAAEQEDEEEDEEEDEDDDEDDDWDDDDDEDEDWEDDDGERSGY
jgi:hypothetical protein